MNRIGEILRLLPLGARDRRNVRRANATSRQFQYPTRLAVVFSHRLLAELASPTRPDMISGKDKAPAKLPRGSLFPY
jgi:hypothetical protein